MTRTVNAVNFTALPMNRRTELVQELMALALFACTLSPFAEMIFHSNESIFVSGHDTESTLAVLLLLIELSFAIGRLLTALLPAVLEELEIVSFRPIANCCAGSIRVLPTVSPPVLLRI